MTCCRCNRTGRCRNCACAKSGKPCQNCLPQRLGNCANTVQTQPSISAVTDLIMKPSSSTQNSAPQIADSLATLQELPSPTTLTNIPVSPPHLCHTDAAENELMLPQATPLADPTFTWSEYDSIYFTNNLNAAFAEAVHWKMNLFKVPYGKVGKSFVFEIARLFTAFATSSALESVALKAATLMPLLLLQKPTRKSKAKEHITCLERRLDTWRNGDLNELLREGRTIQQRISRSTPVLDNKRLSRSFANLMFQGKTQAALRLLSKQSRGGVLHLDDPTDTENGQRKVRDILSEKHPPGQPAHHDAIIDDDPPDVHPVLFESLDAGMIRSAALHTSGAAGPSGLDALSWRRLCTSFKSASLELCHSLAATARRLCTELVDPASIAPLMANRLIALDKNPGVRPIGIGDTARRIIAKAILNTTRQDIQEVASSIQLCAGQISGIEAAVHAVRTLFQREDTEALLLVDATNAFNSLNRQTALHNIQKLCPSIATALINTYRAPSELFVDGDVLLSQEGTTQGDPLAMPMYALATIPFIRKLKDRVNDVSQVWYADDASGAGKLHRLREWWDQINSATSKLLIAMCRICTLLTHVY